jgi:hypothetical protein
MDRLHIGDIVVPMLTFGGIVQEYPEGKIVYMDNGVYHVDLCYKIENFPRVIRCCMVKRVYG